MNEHNYRNIGLKCEGRMDAAIGHPFVSRRNTVACFKHQSESVNRGSRVLRKAFALIKDSCQLSS
jgi:hypothetical protein